MTSIRDLLRCASELPGDEARREAEILLGHCLGRSRSWLYTWPEREVSDGEAQRYRGLLQQRARGVPVAHLTGVREFWSLELAVDEHTLIPRPETETLVEWALSLDLPQDAGVLDLGTGSGAIALALAAERPRWRVTGVDASADALAVAQLNGRSLDLQRVSFRRSNWFAALGGERFDLLVSNPPYVAEGDPHLAAGDVRFEPASALVAGKDGLRDLASLAAAASGHLSPGGWLLLEHGFEQGSAVRERLRLAGFTEVSTRADLAGLERVSGGCLASADDREAGESPC